MNASLSDLTVVVSDDTDIFSNTCHNIIMTLLSARRFSGILKYQEELKKVLYFSQLLKSSHRWAHRCVLESYS